MLTFILDSSSRKNRRESVHLNPLIVIEADVKQINDSVVTADYDFKDEICNAN